MKTRYWIGLLALIAAGCLAAVFLLRPAQPAARIEILSDGKPVAVLPLDADSVTDVGGHNTVTVKEGKVAVTQADCPDHICMKRGWCDRGRDIVCLPNRLVIRFLGPQEADAAVG